MFRVNLQHIGVNDTKGIDKLSKLKWRLKMGGMIISSPSVAGEIVYFGSYDGNLCS